MSCCGHFAVARQARGRHAGGLTQAHVLRLHRSWPPTPNSWRRGTVRVMTADAKLLADGTLAAACALKTYDWMGHLVAPLSGDDYPRPHSLSGAIVPGALTDCPLTPAMAVPTDARTVPTDRDGCPHGRSPRTRTRMHMDAQKQAGPNLSNGFGITLLRRNHNWKRRRLDGNI